MLGNNDLKISPMGFWCGLSPKDPGVEGLVPKVAMLGGGVFKRWGPVGSP